MKSVGFLVAICFVTALFSGCDAPSDPIAFGRLCVPATNDCADQVSLSRNTVGRNTMDVELENQGADAEVSLRVTTSEEIASPSGETVRDDEGRHILLTREYGLAPGEKAIEQYGSFLLTTARTIDMTLECLSAECSVHARYVFISEPLECVDNGDCNRIQTCESTTGRCVECLGNGDCGIGQTCDRENGACHPPTAGGGCSVHSSEASPFSTLLFVVLFIVALVCLHRRRRPALLVTLIATLFITPLTADAAPPQASFAAGGGARVLTGDLGESAGMGYGFILSQELRSRYIGGSLALSTAFFPTTRSGPPIDNSLLTYGVTIGPRGYIPYRRFEFFGAAEYLRWGVASNALVEQTGLEVMFNGIGGVLGARYRRMSLEARVELSYFQLLDLPGSIGSMNFMIGIAP